MKRKIVLAGLLLLAAAFCLSQDKVITGFEIPEYDEENKLESRLSGDKARMGKGSRVVISNLKIESFDEGAVEMTVKAPHCVYNRAKRTARSPARIRIERENMVITGEDYEYNSEKKIFRIEKDVRVVLAKSEVEISPGGKE